MKENPRRESLKPKKNNVAAWLAGCLGQGLS